MLLKPGQLIAKGGDGWMDGCRNALLSGCSTHCSPSRVSPAPSESSAPAPPQFQLGGRDVPAPEQQQGLQLAFKELQSSKFKALQSSNDRSFSKSRSEADLRSQLAKPGTKSEPCPGFSVCYFIREVCTSWWWAPQRIFYKIF